MSKGINLSRLDYVVFWDFRSITNSNAYLICLCSILKRLHVFVDLGLLCWEIKQLGANFLKIIVKNNNFHINGIRV